MPNMRDVAREARAALDRCKKRQAPIRFFESSDGNGCHGWNVCELHYEDSEERYGVGNYEERWGNSQIFLGTDGMLYVHTFSGQEIGPGRSNSGKVERSMGDTVHKAKPNDLKNPLLAFKTRRPYFMAVIEGLQSLPR